MKKLDTVYRSINEESKISVLHMIKATEIAMELSQEHNLVVGISLIRLGVKVSVKKLVDGFVYQQDDISSWVEVAHSYAEFNHVIMRMKALVDKFNVAIHEMEMNKK